MPCLISRQLSKLITGFLCVTLQAREELGFLIITTMVDKQRSLFKKRKKTLICLCSFLVIVVRGGSCCCSIPWTPASQQRLVVTSPPPTFRFTFYLYVTPLLIIQFSRDPIFLELITPSLSQKLLDYCLFKEYTLS